MIYKYINIYLQEKINKNLIFYNTFKNHQNLKKWLFCYLAITFIIIIFHNLL